ncbi:MAG TPA: hypothetical protein VFG20_01270 [Planctomycetaceae bacterium]|nr:hypothetical protein [Planctomycetaceae bacterium]
MRTCVWMMVALLGSTVSHAAPPLPLENLATADDLVAEAQALGKDIEECLASRDSYEEFGSKLKHSTSLLMIVGQVLAEHPQPSKLKAAGADLRDAAIVLNQTLSYDAAKAAQPAVRDALDGKSTGKAAVDVPWPQLMKYRPAMDQMNQRLPALRRVMRRPKDPVVESRQMLAMALLSIPMHADPRIKTPEEIPEWQAFTQSMQTHLSDATVKLKAKDLPAANEAFVAGMANCNKCHERFKPR